MIRFNKLFAGATLLLFLGLASAVHAQVPVFNLNSNLPLAELAVDAGPDLTPAEVYTPQQLNASANGGQGMLQYQWAPTTGLDNGGIANPILTYNTSVTEYTLTITDELGCTISDTISIDFSVSADQSHFADLSMDIFPNPNQGSFHLLVKGKPLKGELGILIRDALGRTVLEEGEIKFTGALDRDFQLGDLQSGVYFLGLSYDGVETVKKLILQ